MADDLTVDQIDQMLADLRAAKQARLTGGANIRVSYEDGSVEKQLATLAEIDGEIARLSVLRSRLSGTPSGIRPLHIRFGGRL